MKTKKTAPAAMGNCRGHAPEGAEKSVAGLKPVDKASPEDMRRFAAWVRRKWEAANQVSLGDSREDFEQDVILAFLDCGFLSATAGWRKPADEQFRRWSQVHLTDRGLWLMRNMRAGTLDEIEDRRRKRMGQKRASGSVKSGSAVLGRCDMFSRVGFGEGAGEVDPPTPDHGHASLDARDAERAHEALMGVVGKRAAAVGLTLRRVVEGRTTKRQRRNLREQFTRGDRELLREYLDARAV